MIVPELATVRGSLCDDVSPVVLVQMYCLWRLTIRGDWKANGMVDAWSAQSVTPLLS